MLCIVPVLAFLSLRRYKWVPTPIAAHEHAAMAVPAAVCTLKLPERRLATQPTQDPAFFEGAGTTRSTDQLSRYIRQRSSGTQRDTSSG